MHNSGQCRWLVGKSSDTTACYQKGNVSGCHTASSYTVDPSIKKPQRWNICAYYNVKIRMNKVFWMDLAQVSTYMMNTVIILSSSCKSYNHAQLTVCENLETNIPTSPPINEWGLVLPTSVLSSEFWYRCSYKRWEKNMEESIIFINLVETKNVLNYVRLFPHY